MIKVMIVEDEPEFLNRYLRILAAETDLRIIAALNSGGAALQALQQDVPDLALIDLGLPDMSGIEIVREIALRNPVADIVVVTALANDDVVMRTIEAGATGYILKEASGPELVTAIRELQRGGSPISPIIAKKILRKFQRPSNPTEAVLDATRDVARDSSASDVRDLLTQRERDVLELIKKGYKYRDAAEYLGISYSTVSSHVKAIYRKLHVSSRGELAFEVLSNP